MTCRICDVVCSRGTMLKRMTSAFTCPSCEYVACVGCTLTWLHQSPRNGCLNCRRPFTDLYLFSNIPKNQHIVHTAAMATFHIAADIVQQPTTRLAVMRIIRTESLQMQLHNAKRLLMTTTHTLKLSAHELKFAKVQQIRSSAEIATMTQAVAAQRQCVRDVAAMMFAADTAYRNHDIRTTDIISVRCANSAQNCIGIVDADMQCLLCEHRNCRDCGVSYTRDHICNPDDIESLSTIRNDSKGCPQCGVMIYRSAGCDYMWCSQCHVNFNWRTMAIVSQSSGHNPEQTQYLANLGRLDRNPTDMRCDVLHARYTAAHCGEGYSRLQIGVRRLWSIHTAHEPNDAPYYAALRVKREMSEYTHPDTGRVYPLYTAEMYHADLRKHIKASRTHRAISDVMYMLYAGMLSLMGDLYTSNTYPQMAVLRKIANKALTQIAAVFGGTRHKLTRIHRDDRTVVPLQYIPYRRHLAPPVAQH